MPLAAGDKLGPYEILSPLGAGGMGEVYKARDTRLERTVAIKVLPDHIAKREDLRARFEREARAVASLNHPHICVVHDIGPNYMVMELIEGETLEARISRGALPLDKALQYAMQTADALDRAHRAGVTHRDIKPGNIMLTRDGVKVLDFGLAKSKAKPALEDRTLTASLTAEGTVLGTPQYMSPEQFEGNEADARSDIWAFGAVLYEMVTGQKAFQGKNYSSLVAAILGREPAPMAVEPFPPASLQRLVRRCLQKDPEDRWQSMRDVVLDLKWPPPESTPPAKIGRWPWVAAMAALLIITAAVTALVVGKTSPNVAEPRLRKFFVALPEMAIDRLQFPVISPDGRKLVFVAHGKLWLREMDKFEARELPGTEGPRTPFWSPDGDWIAFAGNDGQIRKVSILGGEASLICRGAGTFGVGGGGAWLNDEQIVFTSGASGLFQAPASGGDAKPLLEVVPASENDLHETSALPGGKGVLFVTHRRGLTPDTIEVLASGKRKKLLQIAGAQLAFPVYSPTGHILYQRNGGTAGIWALPFSLVKMEASGEPFLVAQRAAFPSVSRDGTLAFVPESATLKRLALLRRNGEQERLFGPPMQSLEAPTFSPDGGRVAVTALADSWDVWSIDVVRETKVRLTFDPRANVAPQWSADGRRVYFARAGPDEIWVTFADGSGKEKRIVSGHRPFFAKSSDASFVVYEFRGNAGNRSDIFSARLGAPDTIEPGSERVILGTPANEEWPVVTRDGRYLAYQSDESGGYQVYVRPFPEGQGKWQASVQGGLKPRWSGDGRELFFADPATNTIQAVSVQAGEGITLGQAKTLFSGEKVGSTLTDGFDVTADAKHFVVAVNDSSSRQQRGMSVVQDWFAEFGTSRRRLSRAE